MTILQPLAPQLAPRPPVPELQVLAVEGLATGSVDPTWRLRPFRVLPTVVFILHELPLPTTSVYCRSPSATAHELSAV